MMKCLSSLNVNSSSSMVDNDGYEISEKLFNVTLLIN